MGKWSIDTRTRPGILAVRLEGAFLLDEMREFIASHNAAVDAFGTHAYRVFVDIRMLVALRPECATELEKAKRYSATRDNFQGSAVLTLGSVVAMQHRRTSQTGGVLDTELISDDEAACWRHLATVRRATKREL